MYIRPTGCYDCPFARCDDEWMIGQCWLDSCSDLADYPKVCDVVSETNFYAKYYVIKKSKFPPNCRLLYACVNSSIVIEPFDRNAVEKVKEQLRKENAKRWKESA